VKSTRSIEVASEGGCRFRVYLERLTRNRTAQYSHGIAMAKWLASFFLLAVMAGGTLAGMPMHSGEKECAMTGMMDCCATARMEGDRPEVRAARLCCALNCTEPGTTAPSSSYKVSPQLAATLRGAIVPPAASLGSKGPPRDHSPPGLRQPSNPAYIRHLALLI
jgi:hypothetical protein